MVAEEAVADTVREKGDGGDEMSRESCPHNAASLQPSKSSAVCV